MNWKIALKIALSVLILYLVIKAIDPQLLVNVIRQSKPAWLIWTLFWFIISKLISAFRFNEFLKTEEIYLNSRQQLRLYWVGMYYNLLLPGGISGDGYKIKLLMDEFKRPFRRLFSITLFDRLSGALALGQLCLLLAFGLEILRHWWWVWVLGLIVSVPASWILFRKMVCTAIRIWGWTSIQSIGVQLAQTMATLGIIFALGQSEQWLSYSFVFLVSSVVAMLPITIGGAGARELTFLWGAQVLGLDTERSVAIAFIFYLVSTAVALYGLVFSFKSVLKT